MRVIVLLALAAVCCNEAARHKKYSVPDVPDVPDGRSVDDRLKQLEAVFEGLSRQVMLQQFYLEEKIRSDGNSGIKTTRVDYDGTRNYHAPSAISNHYLSCHDHANYDRTIGMGELNVVMNGVEFRTRHNDYKLRMPSTTSEDYHAFENVPFPEVPPSVKRKATVDEQIVEMRKYFQAFKNQDTTIVDYKPYFKPVLCYLEGAWTLSTKNLDEPFESDRHFIDASSWFDLMDKVRFTSYTGSKSVLENYALLPTSMYNVSEGIPQYAQWNYRIMCHPIKEELPTSYLQPIDDLSYRFPRRQTGDDILQSRSQRFTLNSKTFDHSSRGNNLLDDIMMTVPGKNNYPADLQDTSFGMEMTDVRSTNSTLINSGYYHRYFKTMKKGAMGTKAIHRGFSDAYLFVAQTTHRNVVPMSTSQCKGKGKRKVCKYWTTRYTYALPLEIVYLTPLLSWNPYNLAKDQPNNIVTGDGKRTGKPTPELAYNGTNYKLYYYTPVDFFTPAKKGKKDPADTSGRGAGVLDKNGEVREVVSSGTRVVLPGIEGVGKIRVRYPIMPIHGEGSGVWKELNALKDMTMHMNRYASLFPERPGVSEQNSDGTYTDKLIRFQVKTTLQDPPGEHSHEISLTAEELDELKKGRRIKVTTSTDNGHAHIMQLIWNTRRKKLEYKMCDGKRACWDGHSRLLERLDN